VTEPKTSVHTEAVMKNPACVILSLVVVVLIALLLGASCGSLPSVKPAEDTAMMWRVPSGPTPRVPSEMGARIEQAANADEAHAAATELLNDISDPVQLGYLFLYCDWKLYSTHWVPPNDEDVFGLHGRPAWYGYARSACLDRLSEMGRQGNDEAIRQLVFVLTEVNHDAGFSLEIGQAFCLIGEPAIPFLEQVEGKHAKMAALIIDVIRKGETFY